MYRVLWGELRRYIGTIVGARHSCWGIVFWLGFGLRTPWGFSPGSFFFGVPVFPRSLSLSFFFFSSFFLVAGLGVFSCSSLARPAGRRRTSGTSTGRSPCLHMSSLPLSPRVGRLPLSSSSFCPLSLSLSSLSMRREVSIWSGHLLAQITVNQVDPACSHTLVSKTKPGVSQRKRFTARLQMAH